MEAGCIKQEFHTTANYFYYICFILKNTSHEIHQDIHPSILISSITLFL